MATDSNISTAYFKLNLLGGCTLTDSSGRVIDLRSRKNRLLLAYLAVPVGAQHSRDKLAALLWEDRQDEQARSSLRTALSGLRQVLGADILLVDGEMISLAKERFETDIAVLLTQGQGIPAIQEAEQLFPGPMLDGFEYDGEDFREWLMRTRAETEEMAVRTLDERAQSRSDAGDHQTAINLLRTSLSIDPLREQTHRAIMTAYNAVGDRAKALAQFRTLKEILEAELGTEPDPETKALADEIAVGTTETADVLRRQTKVLGDQLARAPVIRRDPARKSTVAVLPFVNMSGDAEQGYFADGITEDIITDLGRVKGLSVAARATGKMYRGLHDPSSELARETGVRYVLEGSVRQAGKYVRISARLNDTESGLQIWADRFDRELENIFELQTQISSEIVSALRSNLPETAEPAEQPRGTTDFQAYQVFLRGRQKLDQFSRIDIENAAELFERALTLDPEYADAHAYFCVAANFLDRAYLTDPGRLDRGRASAEKALELDPEHPIAHAAMGIFGVSTNNKEIARHYAERSLELAEDEPICHIAMAQTDLYLLNNMEGAFSHFSRAFELENHLGTAMMILTTLHGLNRPEDNEYYGRVILDAARRRLATDPYDYAATLMVALVNSHLGNVEETRKWAEITYAFDPSDPRSLYNLACIYCLIGDYERTYELLEKCGEGGASRQFHTFMKDTDPDLNAIRQEPRFVELMKKFENDLWD